MAKDVNFYDSYFSKLYVSIPKNTKLIIENKFNGKSVKVSERGFRILMPWQKAKMIYMGVGNFDYKKEVYEDKDGQDVIIDVAITVKVVDPIKYEHENADVEAELKQKLQSILRALIKNHTYEELSGSRFNLPQSKYDTGVAMPMIASTMRSELLAARQELDLFADRYGLAVISLYSQKVEQTLEMQEAYNKKILADREAIAAKAKVDAELERAKINAEIVKTNAKAEAEAEELKLSARYKAILETIKDLPAEQQAEILKAFAIANNNGNANVFMSVGGDDSVKTGIVSGVAAGTTYENKQSKKQK